MEVSLVLQVDLSPGSTCISWPIGASPAAASTNTACLCPAGNNSLLTCMEDGLWSFPEALCELMCLAPPPVPNADLQTARCRESKHKVGSFCKYKCRPGYHVPGSSRKSKK